MIDAAKEGTPSVDGCGCPLFTGEYVTGDVDKSYLERIDSRRNDIAKADRDLSGEAKPSLLACTMVTNLPVSKSWLS